MHVPGVVRWAGIVTSGAVLSFALAAAGAGMLVAASTGGQTTTIGDGFVTAVRERGIAGAAIAEAEGRRLRVELTGYSNLGRKQPVTRRTIFAAGSLGKPLFAYAVLDLARRGQIDLDRPLKDYVPHYFHQQNPEQRDAPTHEVTDWRLNRVTARMILSHTSGFPNWSRHEDLAFSFDPGTRWQYSGEGFLYLQRVVEKLTGQPLETWMAASVFANLGMNETHFAAARVPRTLLATGYERNNHAIAIARNQQALAPSTLLTTITDYGRFLATLVRQHEEHWLEPLFHPQVAVDPKLGLFWTLGLASEVTPQHVNYFHWGANPGFQSLMWMDPKSNRWFVLLTNSDHGLELADWLVPQVVPGKHPALRFSMLHPSD